MQLRTVQFTKECHSRESGNPYGIDANYTDSRFRGNDDMTMLFNRYKVIIIIFLAKYAQQPFL